MEVVMTDGVAELDLTVNEVIARYPATVAVFNRFEIDSCCGGAVPVRAAAERDGADVDAVVQALQAVMEASA
jgi:iron-sulfur cluster repair protein YtfE (RIC family)